MSRYTAYYSRETLKLVRTINENENAQEREVAINKLITSKEKDKSRLLINLLHYSAWRETQASLIKAIGETRENQGVEFLIRFIRDTDDLPLATQAVLGLGYSQSSLAGEFLLDLLNQSDNRLRQESIVGLALMPHFPCDKQLIDIIKNKDSHTSLKLFSIIAAGRRGSRAVIPIIEDIINNSDDNLYNAAILAYGHLASLDECRKLRTQDTTSHLLADELKLYAEDKIQLRSKNDPEELILSILTEETIDWNSSYRRLKEYSSQQIWQTVDILGETLGPTVECLLRAATFSNERAKEDIDFLLSTQEELDVSDAAILARLCILKGGESFIRKFSPRYACQLLHHVRISNILNFSDLYFQPSNDEALAICFINAIVSQSYMSTRISKSLVSWLEHQFFVVKIKPLKHRLIRALTQAGCKSENFLLEIHNELEDFINIPSIYYSLSLFPSKLSTPFILSRVNEALLLKDGGMELKEIVHRLAGHGIFDNADSLSRIPEHFFNRFTSDLLVILTRNAIEGFESFLGEIISSGRYRDRLLAISAVAINGNSELCSLLLNILNSQSIALRERAIHSVCIRGNCLQHLKLFDWFIQKNSFNESTALKILKTLNPKPGEDYVPFVKKLEQAIHDKKGPFTNSEVVAEALSLYDTLVIHHCDISIENINIRGNIHDQDKILTKELRGYSKYSETIKTILRNAELTWQHTELFNQHVDKSTMLIQYCKSIDLILQERLGKKLFNQQDETLLPALQGRIMELGLDHCTFTPYKLIKNLNLEGFFSTAEFPTHKLRALADSIMTGKIMHDRYRTVDGLRAWSLVLLIFARTFSVRNKKLAPILNVKRSSEYKINHIVQLMSRLQDIRNRAAHHGVLVETEQVESIRRDGFTLLNELDSALEES